MPDPRLKYITQWNEGEPVSWLSDSRAVIRIGSEEVRQLVVKTLF